MPSFDEVVSDIRIERDAQVGEKSADDTGDIAMASIAAMQQIILELRMEYVHGKHTININYVRKIAAAAIRILEEHDDRLMST